MKARRPPSRRTVSHAGKSYGTLCGFTIESAVETMARPKYLNDPKLELITSFWWLELFVYLLGAGIISGSLNP